MPSPRFGEFVLDLSNETLEGPGGSEQLTPRVFTLLCYLIDHAGVLVTKRDLLDEVWSDVIVGDAVLKVAVRELRKRLGDDPRQPRFIETVHRRGYRFIAPVVGGESSRNESAPSVPVPTSTPESPLISGRDSALSRLADAWAEAREGRRACLLISGESGIGKTALIDAFLSTLGETRIARGQCVEHHGAGEPYLPMLDAMGRLVRGEERAPLLGSLMRHAPAWLAQLPALRKEVDAEALRRELVGATPERMLREAAEWLEEVTREQPLLLVLEDLHWSDRSTLDLIGSLVRRREPARLFLLASFRGADLGRQDPLLTLRRDFEAQRHCEEIRLTELGSDDSAAYLKRRFDAADEDLARDLHERSGGHPLFLVSLVDHLLARGMLVDGGLADGVDASALEEIPEGIQAIIETELEGLVEDERLLLEVASVLGSSFDTRGLSILLDRDAEDIEDICMGLLESTGLIEDAGLTPGDSEELSFRYRFRHALVQGALYRRLPTARALRLHRAIALAERVWSGDLEAAPARARHCERGQLFDRAIKHRLEAAELAAGRFANLEANAQLEAAWALLPRLSEEMRDEQEAVLGLRSGLLARRRGEMQEAASRFESLAALEARRGDSAAEAEALLYLGSSLFWVGRERCLAVFDRALACAELGTDESLLVHVAGVAAHWNIVLRGWSDEDAAACVHAAESAECPRRRALHVVRRIYLEMLRSNYDVAGASAEEGMRLALDIGEGFDYLLAHFLQSWNLLHARRFDELRDLAARGIRFAERNGHRPWSLLLQLVQAQHAEAEGKAALAEELATPALVYSEEAPRATGQLLAHSRIVLGRAALLEGDQVSALEHFSIVAEMIKRDPTDVDRMLHLPYLEGLARAQLQSGDTEAAARNAESLFELASRSGEANYILWALRLKQALGVTPIVNEEDIAALRIRAPLAAASLAGRESSKLAPGD